MANWGSMRTVKVSNNKKCCKVDLGDRRFLNGCFKGFLNLK